MTERNGDTSIRQPVNHSVFLEQSFDTTHLVVQPKFPLADRGTFAVRIKKGVTDITGQFDFQGNAARTRLRGMFEFLDTARRLNPGVPVEQLQDPPPALTSDWPGDAASRGLLKRNLLALGDTHPDEIDPRVMLLFTTRDEPVSEGALAMEYVKRDGAYDPDLSTGSWDEFGAWWRRRNHDCGCGKRS